MDILCGIELTSYRLRRQSRINHTNKLRKELKKVNERLYTVKDAAEQVLNCSRPTVYRLIKEGKLTPVKFLSDLRIKHSDLLAYINSLPPSKRKK